MPWPHARPLTPVYGFLAFVATSQMAEAEAEDLSLRVNGVIDAYIASATLRHATDLVPFPAAAGYRDAHGGGEATFRITSRTGALTVGSQLRLAADHENEADLHVDEAYAELLLGNRIFAFAGRRILAWGQSHGLNPADFFRDPQRENAVFRQAQARSRVEGADMIGTDILFDNGRTLTLLNAPGFDRRHNGQEEDIALIRLSGFAFDGALDHAVTAISGDRPGAGVSLNHVIGEASVVYLDSAFRRGREKRSIAAIDPAGSLMLDPPETGGVIPHFTLGLGHTFGNGLSMNLEYTHDAGGYSNREWERIVRALDHVTPAISVVHGQTLGQLNGLLDHHTLRRNYAFVHIAHDGLFGSQLAIELTALHGMDDGSGTLGLRLEHPLTDQITVGLRASRKYGGTNTEFTLRPETNSIALYAGVTF